MKISSFRFTQMIYTELLLRIFKFEKSHHAIAMAGSKRHANAKLQICRRRRHQPTPLSLHCRLTPYPPGICRRIALVNISIHSTPTSLPPPTAYPTEIHQRIVIAIAGISSKLHLNLKTIVASKFQSCLQQTASRRMHRSSQEERTESSPMLSVK